MGSRDAPETLVSVDGGDQCSLVSEKNRTWFVSTDKYDKVGCNERDGVRSSADKTQMSETVRKTSETGSGDAWRWRERGRQLKEQLQNDIVVPLDSSGISALLPPPKGSNSSSGR
jgi:hypothetical protein